jgi:D-alanyl-lipoteichoic acid acyltransferase DltB (MBOAT superfamily)
MMVNANFQPLDIILPVGISFYTFQSISYIVDVYRGDVEPTHSWFEYLFFLSFFPALVAGPIVRANYFLPQLQERKPITANEVYMGLWLVIIGIVKKAIVADYISQYNDLIFASPTGYSGFESLMGAIGYTMQIYCDFSGYSDMAIGIALIMGFKLSKNFDFPYKAGNLTQFWRQWHISLSSWLRDYLYIPLGGNRRGVIRTYVNNFVTMLLGGLWHGAAWKFIFWGAMHGIGLAIHKACKPWLTKVPDTWCVKALGWSITMIYVSTLWVFFRANTWTDSWLILHNIFTNFHTNTILPFITTRSTWCILMLLIILTHTLPRRWHEFAAYRFVTAPWIIKLLLFIATVQLVVEFMSAEVSPFIYFQF